MIAAFVIGFVGSLHCLGMCGPLNLLMIGKSRSLGSFLLYHSGRISVYVLIGLILGILGFSLALFQAQVVVTFIAGASLLLVYGIPGIRGRVERAYYRSRFYQFIRRNLTKNLDKRNRWFLSGVANGFLPCGLTYVAAAGAVVMGSLIEGALFMTFFGLGTMPALSLLTLTGALSSDRLRKIIPNTISVVAVISGGILVLRGLLISLPEFNQMVQANAAGLITVCGL